MSADLGFQSSELGAAGPDWESKDVPKSESGAPSSEIRNPRSELRDPAFKLTLLVATTNRGKLDEIRWILTPLPLDLRTLADFPGLAEPTEHGSTFAENARLKAVHYARATGLLSVAEDSGLEIEALDGAPGVHSARYNGRTYPEKFDLIYEQLRTRRRVDSAARFVCALAVARGGEVVFEARGVVEGRIAPAPLGDGGFGYDPIFYYPPYGRTLAQVTTEEKAAVSHRGKAFRTLREYVATLAPPRP